MSSIVIAQVSTGATIVSSATTGIQGPAGPSVAAGAAGQFYVTNAAATKPEWKSLSGDVTDSATTTGQVTVTKVNGATVPAAGALTSGDVLQVSGVSALSYGKVPSSGVSPGTAWQSFTTKANASASLWTTPPTADVVALYGADPTGTLDSSTAFQNAVNALANSGVAMFVPTGTYKLAVGVTLKSNLKIVCGSNVSFSIALTTGAFSTSTVPFIAAPTYGSSITFNASASAGAYQVVLNTAVNVGDDLALIWSDGFHGGAYTVQAVSGLSTPQTVTLDRALDIDFPSSSTAEVMTGRPENIIFEGNACSISGTCERYFEILSPYRCHFRDIVIDATSFAGDTQTALSLDTWGLESTFERIKIINALTGMAIESGTRCQLIDCVAVGRDSPLANTGHLLIDCISCATIRPGISLFSQGVVLSEGSANNVGCIESYVLDGLVTGCTTGVVVAFAQNCNVRGTYANGNTTGFSVNGSATLMSNIGGRGNGALAIVVGTGCAIDGIDCSQNVNYGVQAQATCTIRGLISSGGNAGGQVVYVATANVTCYLSNFDITVTPAAFAMQVNNASARLVARSGHIAINADGSEGIYVNAGSLDVDGLIIDGTGTGCFSVDVASGGLFTWNNFQDAIGQRLQAGALGVLRSATTSSLTMGTATAGMTTILQAGAATTIQTLASTGTEFANLSTPAAGTGPRVFGSSGALKCVGSSGTITTMGPADLEGFAGHCPCCGTDFAVEWSNEKMGALTVCMNCLAEELGDRPWIVRRPK